MLQVDDLIKDFGTVTAVNGVSFTVEPGEMIAVLGSSGAGKSTLLRCLNRLEAPTSGRILFNGQNIGNLKGDKLDAWRFQCAMIFQQFQLVPRLNVLTNVLIGGLHEAPLIRSLFKMFPRKDRERAIIELDRLGMAEKALQRAGTLSGGQQQRVAIAKAMMQSPKILLADEPIASLDTRNAHAVMQTLKMINKDRGITVLVNLHALDMARTYCDRIIGMRDGAIVFDGPGTSLDEKAIALIYDGEIDETIVEVAPTLTLDRETAA